MAWIETRRNGWLVVWRKDGKRKSKYFSDENEALEYKDSLDYPYRKGITSAEVMDRLTERMGRSRPKARLSPFLASYARVLLDSATEMAEGSLDGYRSTLRNHLEDSVLGSMPIANITPADVRKFWGQAKATKTYSANGKGMRSNVYQLLARTFNQAVRDDIIPSSPLSRSGIKRPSKRRAVEVIPLTVDQIEALAAATANERNRLCILLGAYAGLRGGEVGGLRLADLDVAKCRLNIFQAVSRSRSGLSLGLPKGGKRRSISVAYSIVEDVAKFSKEFPRPRTGASSTLPPTE